MGNKEASLTLVEFSDYQCLYCGRFYQNILPQIKKDYIDTGKLKYVFKDFPIPIHRQAQKAAEAAHCAGEEGKYWEKIKWLKTYRHKSIKNLNSSQQIK